MVVFITKQRQGSPLVEASRTKRERDSLSGLVLSINTLLPASRDFSTAATHFCQVPKESRLITS